MLDCLRRDLLEPRLEKLTPDELKLLHTRGLLFFLSRPHEAPQNEAAGTTNGNHEGDRNSQRHNAKISAESGGVIDEFVNSAVTSTSSSGESMCPPVSGASGWTARVA